MLSRAKHVFDARLRLTLLLLLLLLAGNAFAAAGDAQLRIGVATMQPGTIFFERFGHDSIVVDDPALPEPISYNFGFFDPGEPHFLRRFIRGEMAYQLAALPLSQDMAYYRDVGRGVSIQWLDLDDAQAKRLAAALAENAKPENARYRYEYFTDNCATRVRDALDRVLDGGLRPQLETRSQGNSYRSESVRLASPATWMWLGFDLGLGPAADRPMSRWQDAFVPMQLAAGLREAKLADGRPLVKSEEILLPHRIAPEPGEFQRHWWKWLLIGMAIAIGVLALSHRAARATTVVAISIWLLCGLLGALMTFIWLETAHRFGWANHNLLLFNPLCLLLLPGAVQTWRGRDPGPGFRLLLGGVVACAAAALFLHWLPVARQANAHWIAMLVPIHLALAYVFAREGALSRPRTWRRMQPRQTHGPDPASS